LNQRLEAVESDWRDYYGSLDNLTADIEQFRHRVLESDEWYNGHIRVRVHKSQKIITESNK